MLNYKNGIVILVSVYEDVDPEWYSLLMDDIPIFYTKNDVESQINKALADGVKEKDIMIFQRVDVKFKKSTKVDIEE